jgi:hypothetical protein
MSLAGAVDTVDRHAAVSPSRQIEHGAYHV